MSQDPAAGVAGLLVTYGGQRGGNDATQGGAGGMVTFEAGTGGNTTGGANAGGAGGDNEQTAGTGGTSAGGVGGVGGNSVQQGGDGGAGVTQGDGGDAIIRGGAGDTDGTVIIGLTNTSAINSGTGSLRWTHTGILDLTQAATTEQTVDFSELIELNMTGAGTETASIIIGDANPNTGTGVTAGDVGSLFIDATNAMLYQKTGAPSTWTAFGTGTQTLDSVITGGTPDNDVDIPSANPIIFRDGGVAAFDVMTISKTGAGTGHGFVGSMGASTTENFLDITMVAGSTGDAISITQGTAILVINETGFVADGDTSWTGVVAAGDTVGHAISITGGQGGVATAGAAGAGGAITDTGGTGGAAADVSGGSAGAGGAVSYTGGTGGAGVDGASFDFAGGAGGSSTCQGGPGGVGTAATLSGAGGNASCLGGNAGATGGFGTGAGGDATIDAGTGSPNGTVNIGTTNAGDIASGSGNTPWTHSGRLIINQSTGLTVALDVNATGGSRIELTTDTGQLDIKTTVGGTSTSGDIEIQIDSTAAGATSGNLIIGTISSGNGGEGGVEVRAGGGAFTVPGPGEMNLICTNDMTLGARGSTITLNESGDESLDGGFTATSIIGALNELLTGGISGNVSTSQTVNSTTAISAGEPVALMNQAGSARAFQADANAGDQTEQAIGIAAAAGAVDAAIEVVLAGEVDVPDAAFTGGVPAVTNVGDPVFVSDTVGLLSLTAPGGASRVLKVGIVSRGGSGAVRLVLPAVDSIKL